MLENPDGVSGFTPIGGDLDASARTFDHRVAPYSRLNARYLVQACNAAGCTDPEERLVSGTLAGAVGYVKASNAQGITDTGDGDRFGQAVSLSADGTTSAVGAPDEDGAATGIDGDRDDDSSPGSGAVHVFARVGGTWRQQACVEASNTHAFSGFGAKVGLSADGETLAVSAPAEQSAATGVDGDQDDRSAPRAGAVYVFARDGDGWRQQGHLKASDTGEDDRFGSALALGADGDTLAVGAPEEDGAATGIDGDQADGSDTLSGAGAVYVFAREGGNWRQQAYVRGLNVDRGRGVDSGTAVDLSGDGDALAVGTDGECSAATGIGGDQDDVSAPLSGAAYLY